MNSNHESQNAQVSLQLFFIPLSILKSWFQMLPCLFLVAYHLRHFSTIPNCPFLLFKLIIIYPVEIVFHSSAQL